DLVWPGDELGDRRDRLRAPRRNRGERKLVLKPGARHAARERALIRAGEERGLAGIGDGAHAAGAGVGDRARFVEFGRLAVEVTEQEGLPHLADRIDIAV